MYPILIYAGLLVTIGIPCIYCIIVLVGFLCLTRNKIFKKHNRDRYTTANISCSNSNKFSNVVPCLKDDSFSYYYNKSNKSQINPNQENYEFPILKKPIDEFIDIEKFVEDISIPITNGDVLLDQNYIKAKLRDLEMDDLSNVAVVGDEVEIILDRRNDSRNISEIVPTMQLQHFPSRNNQFISNSYFHNLRNINDNSSFYLDNHSLQSFVSSQNDYSMGSNRIYSPPDDIISPLLFDQSLKETKKDYLIPLCLEFDFINESLKDTFVKKKNTFKSIIKPIKPTKHSGYAHCGVCYENQAKSNNWENCYRCGLPLCDYIHFNESDRFCIVCSVMNKYDTSKKGRCTLHLVKKNNIYRGSNFFLYKKYFVIGSASKPKKDSEESRIVKKITTVWPLNQIIRYLYFDMIKNFIDTPYSENNIVNSIEYIKVKLNEFQDEKLNINDIIQMYFVKFKIKPQINSQIYFEQKDFSIEHKQLLVDNIVKLCNSLLVVLDEHYKLLKLIGSNELKKKSKEKYDELNKIEISLEIINREEKRKQRKRSKDKNLERKRIKFNPNNEQQDSIRNNIQFQNPIHQNITIIPQQIVFTSQGASNPQLVDNINNFNLNNLNFMNNMNNLSNINNFNSNQIPNNTIYQQYNIIDQNPFSQQLTNEYFVHNQFNQNISLFQQQLIDNNLLYDKDIEKLNLLNCELKISENQSLNNVQYNHSNLSDLEINQELLNYSVNNTIDNGHHTNLEFNMSNSKNFDNYSGYLDDDLIDLNLLFNEDNNEIFKEENIHYNFENPLNFNIFS